MPSARRVSIVNRALLLGVGLLVAVFSLSVILAQGEGGALPAEVQADVETLTSSFLASCEPPYVGGGMRATLEAHQEVLWRLIAFADQGQDRADALARHLLGSLQAYARRYEPETEIPREELSRTSWEGVRFPSQGVDIQVYLLTQVLQRTGDAQLARQALKTFVAVTVSSSYWWDQYALAQDPQASPRHAPGVIHSQLRGLVAWCCEDLMARLQAQPAPWMTLENCAICDQFVDWRTVRTNGSKLLPELSYFDQQETMKWVEKLAATIPAE